jgi:hypothetical protein
MPATAEQIKLAPGDHVVHFYQDDRELARTVGAHLADALDQHAMTIVIATEPHRRAFERELGSAGTDARRVVASGRLIFLDAAATLAELMVEGEISREAFQRAVGTVLRDAGATGGPVRAYGEMVDLLWQAGDVASAIELEKLWNELIAELSFSLLCAYHSAAVEAPEHEHALREVCQLHSSVTPQPATDASPLPASQTARELWREFQPEDDTPGTARHLLEEAFHQWGGDAAVLLDDARLLLSELVSNAVLHARSPLLVSIRWQASSVRLAVRDKSPDIPTVRSELRDAGWGGWGLQVVQELSRNWGVDATPDGKTVWAEL